MAVYNGSQAPTNAQVGDTINTQGGLYQIVHPGTPGSSFNKNSGYSSINLSNASLQDALTAYAQATSERNTAKSQDFAREQMQFQDQSNAKAMRFSAEQAQVNRDWQEKMSNTAHQREVADLIAAGLNPVLSSKYGGATTPSGGSASGVTSSGSKGDVDSTSQQMIGALLSAVISQSTALQTTAMTNMNALEMSKISAGAILGSANISASSNQYMQQKQQAFEEYLKDNYPQNIVGGVSSLVQNAIDSINKASGSASENHKSNAVLKHIYDTFNNLSKDDWGALSKLFK